jgi:hypothetical protein
MCARVPASGAPPQRTAAAGNPIKSDLMDIMSNSPVERWRLAFAAAAQLIRRERFENPFKTFPARIVCSALKGFSPGLRRMY